MSTETDLASASSATDLIPGDPSRINEVAGLLSQYATSLSEAAHGFGNLTAAQWSGQAADTFRARFAPEPARWQTAADAFNQAATATSVYATSLLLAQNDAADALTRYQTAHAATQAAQQRYDQTYTPTAGMLNPPAFDDPGTADRVRAVLAVEDARGRVQTAGNSAHNAVRAATDQAPAAPSWWSTALHTIVDLTGYGAQVAYNNVVVPAANGIVDVSLALGQNPVAGVEVIGGAALTIVSGAGDVVGGVLSATGLGAVGGVPLIAVSATGVLTGVTLVMSGAGQITTSAMTQNADVVPQIGGEGKQRPELAPYDGDKPPGVGDDWQVGRARNGKGDVWQLPGAKGDSFQVRFEDPDAKYPNGCVRFYNKYGQPIDLNGNPGSNADTHIPINDEGTYQVPKGWNT